MDMNSKRILVTGAAGFLGSHLCDSLLNEDNRVIGVDNLSTGNEANLAHLCNESRFEFVQQDSADRLMLTQSTLSSTSLRLQAEWTMPGWGSRLCSWVRPGR
jgi:nucleoside-diphosphate-sugar epimerase